MYVDPDRVLDKLPGAYPLSWAERYPEASDETLSGLWRSKVEAEIAHYSRYIDDAVGPQYPRLGTYKFPLCNADPATPGVIGEICYQLTISELLTMFHPVTTGNDDGQQVTDKERAEAQLKRIRSGEIVICLDDGVGSVSSPTVKVISRTNRMTDCAFRSYGR